MKLVRDAGTQQTVTTGRRLPCWLVLPRDFLAGIKGFSPLSFYASLNQSAS